MKNHATFPFQYVSSSQFPLELLYLDSWSPSPMISDGDFIFLLLMIALDMYGFIRLQKKYYTLSVFINLKK